MLSLLIGPLLAPRAFSRRPLSVDRHPPVMTYKANTRQAAAEEGPASATEAKMEFFLTVAFLINDVERRFHYQYDSFQECSQAREVMVKDETPLWATLAGMGMPHGEFCGTAHGGNPLAIEFRFILAARDDLEPRRRRSAQANAARDGNAVGARFRRLQGNGAMFLARKVRCNMRTK